MNQKKRIIYTRFVQILRSPSFIGPGSAQNYVIGPKGRELS